MRPSPPPPTSLSPPSPHTHTHTMQINASLVALLLLSMAVAAANALDAPNTLIHRRRTLSSHSLHSRSFVPPSKAEIHRRMSLQPRDTNNAVQLAARAGSGAGPPLPAGVEPTAGCQQCKSSLSFAGPAAQKYAVGNQIPTLPFKTKTSWAGNMPIKGDTLSADASLYFWLWGKDDVKSGNDLVIWLNGGPGCSSLGGMVLENGPFLYQSRAGKPFPNPYSWTKGADMLYVEQPVGVGFTTGTANLTNEQQLADQFASFLDNFYTAFPEMASKKLWITGESYAGQYIPYFMDHLYNRPGNTPQLQGGLMIDAIFTDETVHDLAAYSYALKHKTLLKLTDSDLADIKKEAGKCGLLGYLAKNLNYPPKGRLPDFSRTCSPWYVLYNAAQGHNGKFNVYNIATDSTAHTSPLGDPNGGEKQYKQKTFFDNDALQAYIHAPKKKWVDCNNKVFAGGNDLSLPPDASPSYDHSIMAGIVEKSKQFLVLNGGLDILILNDGVALGLQNLTWNGAQGFSKPPTTPLYDMEGNVGGMLTQERGLIFAEIPKAGHMIPADTPSTGLAALLKLIGAREWTK